MIEDVVIRMGLDNRPIETGLRGVKRSFTNFSTSMLSELKTFAAQAAAPITAFFSAGKIRDQVEEVAHLGKAIKQASEEMGTSYSFTQGLAATWRKLGYDADKAAEAMGKLSVNVGHARAGSAEMVEKFAKYGIAIAGLSNEEVFYKIADAMKQTADPAARTALAVDLLGEGAKKMASAMAVGGHALKEMIDGAKKLSDGQIEKLAALDLKLEQIGKKWRLLWAEIATAGVDLPSGGISERSIAERMEKLSPGWRSRKDAPSGSWSSATNPGLMAAEREKALREQAIEQLQREEHEREQASAKTIADQQAAAKQKQEIAESTAKAYETEQQYALEAMSAEDRLVQLEHERASLLAMAVDKRASEVERAKALEAFAKADVAARKTAAEVEKKKTEEAKKQADSAKQQKDALQAVTEARAHRAEAVADLATAKGDRSHFSLQDLAGLDIDRNTTGDMRQQIMTARQIQWWQGRARFLSEHGYDADAQNIYNRIDKVRSGMTALTESERFPWKSMERSLANTEKNIEEMLRRMANEGIEIIPRMGK